jgi:hypothetical protein
MDLTFLSTVIAVKFFVDCVLLVRVGIPSLWKEWKLFLARKSWCYWFLVCVCGPFMDSGVKGEEEYP